MSGEFGEPNPSEATPPPSWAVRSVEAPAPNHAKPSGRGKGLPPWLFPTLGALLLALAIGGAAYFFSNNSEDASPPTTGSASAVTAGEGAVVVPSPTATTNPTPSTPATSAPTTQPSTASTVPNTTAPPTTEAVTATTSGIFSAEDTRRAVFKGGVVYLGGEVPSQEVADLIAERVAAIVGPENVVVEYTINPDAPLPDSAPLHVADLVLFDRGTAEITGPFFPLLDLGTRLFEVSPNVRVEVIAHTDSESSAAFNQGLSEQRAAAVKQYWVDAGVDPSRITATGKGESEPIASNETEEGKRLNRRAEFIIIGLIG